MQSVPSTYQGYDQGSRSVAPGYSKLHQFQWMADVVSNEVVLQQAAQASRYTEHHIYYHFVPMEPGAPANSPSFHTNHSLFSTPNWSIPSSAESSPECGHDRLEMPRVSRISVGSRRGAVSYNPPPPAYNTESARHKDIQLYHNHLQPTQAQNGHADTQSQPEYTQAHQIQPHVEFTRPERALTPKEFIRELQHLLVQCGGDQSSASRFHILGEEIPVSVWRPDQNGPFLVQHYLPNGQEDAISVAHIANGGRIMWVPPPNVERFAREWWVG
ncbi:hypothetical protein OPQ81_008668 [Rhizoctonia solani]|nr:hypothetical protein OPQ81_008668 [Rhizoctonia solani]